MITPARQPGRQVSLNAREANSITVMLDTIENWLRRAPDDVIASLAASAYGEPTPRAFGWARELISDLRYHSAAMALDIRGAGNPQDTMTTAPDQAARYTFYPYCLVQRSHDQGVGRGVRADHRLGAGHDRRDDRRGN